MVESLLSVENLTAGYPCTPGLIGKRQNYRPVISGISFAINPGETVAFVGPSGGGKTSLAMALAGFLKPESGIIRFRGEKLDDQARGAPRKIQLIFQDAGGALNPHLNIGAAIAEACAKNLSKRECLDQVMHFLQMVELGAELIERYPAQLSGGQKQRVCIARALAAKPELLILDEPFSAQDLLIQVQLTDLLRHLKSTQKLTLILIAHDLLTVRSLADRVGIIARGHLIEYEPTAVLFSQPRTALTRALLEAAELDV